MRAWLFHRFFPLAAPASSMELVETMMATWSCRLPTGDTADYQSALRRRGPRGRIRDSETPQNPDLYELSCLLIVKP